MSVFKKVIKIVLVVGLLALLCGCERERPEPWMGFTYTVTSTEQAEECHFAVMRLPDGGMSFVGYCYDGENECRVDDETPMSQKGAKALDKLKLEKARPEQETAEQETGDTTLAVVLYSNDGTERKVTLPRGQQKKLLEILRREVIGQK